MLPLFSITTCILNVISLKVFNKIQFQNKKFYRYIIAHTILNILLLVLLTFLSPLLCKQLCPWSNNYWLKKYELWTRAYFVRVIKLANTFISVTIIIYYNLCVSKCHLDDKTKAFFNEKTFKIFIILFFTISCLYYLPNVFLKQKLVEFDLVFSNNNYIMINYIYSNNYVFKHTVASSQYLTHLVSLFIVISFTSKIIFHDRKLQHLSEEIQIEDLPIIDKSSLKNSLNINRLSKKYKRPRKQVRFIIDGEILKIRNSNTQIKLIVFWMSIVFLIDHFAYSIGYTIYFYFDSTTEVFRTVFLFIHILVIACSFLNICIYYKFDNSFAIHFNAYLKKSIRGSNSDV